MRILVTNDDGIDSIGLHVLARAICELEGDHEVVVAAPDQEYSGAGAALGALHLIQPEVRRGHIDNCPVDCGLEGQRTAGTLCDVRPPRSLR